MNASEVYSCLELLPAKNIGVYASDCLPRRISPSTAIVVNTDPHNKRGTHWVAFYLDGKGHLEYFDSFGQPPLVSDHIRFIRRNCSLYKFNSKMLQDYDSELCGHYCLGYLYFRSIGSTMPNFVNLFSENRISNDQYMFDLFQYLYKF